MRVRVPPPALMEPLLSVASELEARDARVAAELARVESDQRVVDDRRARATELAELLAWLPRAISENESALHAARGRRDDAAAAVAAADDEARARAEALRAAAEADVARLEEHRTAFADQTDAARDAVAELARAVGAEGLDHTLETLSQRRGALLVEHANLVRERDAVVREASELLGSVLGDPLASTSVSGLRERLERALA
jgi:chromosome segregation ATPase